jgi:hypothetical protein
VAGRHVHGGARQLNGQLDVIHPVGELQHVRQHGVETLQACTI